MQFTDTKFMSANEKTKVAKAWKTFLESDMAFSKFPQGLYNHLMQHCNHIAHYDRGGFYEAQCTPQARSSFLNQFANDHTSGRLYWGAYTDYKDIGQAMYDELRLHYSRLTA